MDKLKELLLSIDPDATKFQGAGKGNYTVWTPYGENALQAGNRRREVAAAVQIDRFTKDDPDEIADAIYAALDAAAFVAFEYLLDYEPDTGYIHHIYDCEVW